MNKRKQQIWLQNKFHLTLSIFLILFLTISAKSIAKRKKLPNCLKSIVLFSQKTDDQFQKREVTGTGFLISYNEKLVVATNLNIIYYSLKPKIKTIDGKELKYTKILIPKDKRNIILFELDPETPQELWNPLELEMDVSSETGIDDKVYTYGCKSNWQTVTSAKGKVTGLGPVNIEIKSKVPYNMNGGPVLSYNTGKVIGVISKFATTGKDKSRYCKAIRIDSIKGTTTLSDDEFMEDLRRLKQKEAIIVNLDDKYSKFTSEIEELSEKIKAGSGTNQASISKIKKQHQELVKKVKMIVAQMDSDKVYSMKYFRSRHRHAVNSAEKIITKFIELEESFEKLEEENKEAGKKNNFKGIDLLK